MDTPLYLSGGYIQTVHLALDAVADGFEGLLVVAALHHDVLAAVGQDLPFAALVRMLAMSRWPSRFR